MGGSGGNGVSGDPYADVVPSEEMLSLTLDEASDADNSQALTRTYALEGDPSTFQAKAREIAERLNAAMQTLQQKADMLKETAEVEATSRGRLSCQRWVADGENANFRLRSCELEARAERYSFVLEGRSLDSDNEEDYTVLMAGKGKQLPAYEGRRRGAGRIGFDFDASNQLFGSGPTGKLSVGYRAAGPLRKLNLGLLEFQSETAEAPMTARHRYLHWIGRGGWLRAARHGDFITVDESDNFVGGTDGTEEFGRFALAWSRGGAARVAAAACGGTIGEQQCVRVAQCYESDGAVSYEDIQDGNAEPQWSEMACPDLPESIAVEEPPAQEEVDVEDDSGDEDVPGPEVEEPESEPDMEAAGDTED